MTRDNRVLYQYEITGFGKENILQKGISYSNVGFFSGSRSDQEREIRGKEPEETTLKKKKKGEENSWEDLMGLKRLERYEFIVGNCLFDAIATFIPRVTGNWVKK